VRRINPSPLVALAVVLSAWTAVQAVLWATECTHPRPSAPLPEAFFPDINRAPMRHLLLLPHVGPARAKAIVEERARAGPFAGPVDLQRVPGIGPRIAAVIREAGATAGAP